MDLVTLKRNAVRDAMGKLNLSLTELSVKTGINLGQLSTFVRSGRGIGDDKFGKLLHELGVSVYFADADNSNIIDDLSSKLDAIKNIIQMSKL